MKKILVTGASGFIGTYVTEHLLAGGHHVIASSFRPEKAHTASWWGKTEYIPFDMEGFDPDTNYYSYFGRPDILIHLAWEGLPNYKSPFHLEVNYPRHAAFLDNLTGHGLKDITVTGTCLEYGMQEGCLSEEMQVMPGNPYAIAKDQLRRHLEGMGKLIPEGNRKGSSEFLFRWIRLFYMYGNGQNPKSLLSQLDRALAAGDKVFNMSGGEQERDYLPVEQVAEYIVRIALQRDVTGVINCCSGKPVRVKDFVEDYLRNKNAHIVLNLGYYPYPDYEPMRFWGNDAKLKTILRK